MAESIESSTGIRKRAIAERPISPPKEKEKPEEKTSTSSNVSSAVKRAAQRVFYSQSVYSLVGWIHVGIGVLYIALILASIIFLFFSSSGIEIFSPWRALFVVTGVKWDGIGFVVETSESTCFNSYFMFVIMLLVLSILNCCSCVTLFGYTKERATDKKKDPIESLVIGGGEKSESSDNPAVVKTFSLFHKGMERDVHIFGRIFVAFVLFFDIILWFNYNGLGTLSGFLGLGTIVLVAMFAYTIAELLPKSGAQIPFLLLAITMVMIILSLNVLYVFYYVIDVTTGNGSTSDIPWIFWVFTALKWLQVGFLALTVLVETTNITRQAHAMIEDMGFLIVSNACFLITLLLLVIAGWFGIAFTVDCPCSSFILWSC